MECSEVHDVLRVFDHASEALGKILGSSVALERGNYHVFNEDDELLSV